MNLHVHRTLDAATAAAPQGRLRAGFAAGVFVAALAPGIGEVAAGQTRAYMSVTANVVESVSVRALHQAQSLVITAADVARGYVEVAAGSRFEIANKGPCLFEFRPVGSDVFRSVKVTGLERSGEFGTGGGAMLHQPAADRHSSVSMTYRFDLTPGIMPGAYKWPLALTVLPM